MTRPAVQAEHLLIESQGPLAGPGCARFIGDAAVLARGGHTVRLFLIQDGVTAAVPGAVADLPELLRHSAVLWVDRFSADQRGLVADSLVAAAELVDLGEVATQVLASGVKVVWH